MLPRLDGHTIEGRYANYLAEMCGVFEFRWSIARALGAGVGLTPKQAERTLNRMLKKGVIGESWRRKGWYHLS